MPRLPDWGPPDWGPRLLGVIDLLAGSAVHAMAGRRGEYQPHLETARSSPSPLTLAEIYRHWGVGGLYIADLDAIAGGPCQAGLLNELVAGDLPVWLDAGVRSVSDLHQKRSRVFGDKLRWVLATETFAGALVDIEDPAGLTLGIDLQGGRVRHCGGPVGTIASDAAAVSAGSLAAALALVDQWFQRGGRSVLPLEITSVGLSAGPATASLCRQIRENFPEVELLSGGGVRDALDLQRLIDAGCDRVLVATALLNGRISRFPRPCG